MVTEKSWYANIWIAGDIDVAKQVCRKYVFQHPLCVTVTPTSFIYTGGQEEGVIVRMIHYPRFPQDRGKLVATSMQLATELCEQLCQWSYSIEWPDETTWFSRRKPE